MSGYLNSREIFGSLVIYVLVGISMLPYARADYRISVGLQEFNDPDNTDWKGKCCDPKFWWQRCKDNCDFIFDICIEPMPSGSNVDDDCSTGWKNTGVVQDESDDIKFQANHKYGGWYNPQSFSFSGLWQGFYLKFRVTDYDGGSIFNADDLVDSIVIPVAAPSVSPGMRNSKIIRHQRPKPGTITIYTFWFQIDCTSGSGQICSPTTTTAPTTTTTTPTTTTATTTPPPKRDCSDWLKAGVTKNSIQIIWPTGSPYPINVYCDMSDDGGGWTLIQQRVDNITDFDYPWESYREGFGEDMSTFTSNFWLGNDQIHYITSQKTYTLRIDLWDCSDGQAFEEYTAFKIDDETNFYIVHVSNSSGPAGDSFNPLQAGLGDLQDGMKFSTVDKDNDNWAYSCAKYFHGGWWFNACGLANLNGQYKVGCFYSSPFQDGITWYTWKNEQFSLKKVTMKVRPTITD